MMKNKIKMKQYIIITLLATVCVVMITVLIGSNNHKDKVSITGNELVATTEPTVEEIEIGPVDGVDVGNTGNTGSIDEDIATDPEKNVVIVDPIRVDKGIENGTIEVETDVIEVPMPVEPERPEMVPPEERPITTDDLDNKDQLPTYDDEEIIIVPEPEIVVEQSDVPKGTYLVPDSENPFLQSNIPSNGDGGEIQGKDLYQDGVPAGEGDKF